MADYDMHDETETRDGQNTDDASETNLRRTPDGEFVPLSPEQANLLCAYRERDGLVVGAAGSGAGKTRVGVECFGDSIWRHLDATGELPDNAVFATFTKTAARDIRETVEKRLRDHITACEQNGATEDPIYRRWDEVRTWVQERADVCTLDSLILTWYDHLASVSDLPTDTTVEDGIATEVFLERIERDLRTAATDDTELADAIDVLEARYGANEDDVGPANWVTELYDALRAGRDYCEDVEWVCTQLQEGVDKCFGGGRPETQKELQTAVEELSDESPPVSELGGEVLAKAQQSYDATSRLVDAFCLVLRQFEGHYDSETIETGVFDHDDVTYLVATILDPEAEPSVDIAVPYVEELREQLRAMYSHVIIDEAQDNSYAQMQAIRYIFDGAGDDTETLYIGDLKQSIYGWRGADPDLFADLIGTTDDPDRSPLGVETVEVEELNDSFRSHPHILDFVNDTFPTVFDGSGRGDLGSMTIPYRPLRARRLETESEDPHIHVLQIPPGKKLRGDRVEWEAEEMAQRLRGAVDQGVLSVDEKRTLAAVDSDGRVDRGTATNGQQPSLQSAEGGQIAFIFRSMFYAPTYARQLNDHGFQTAILSGSSLFETPEVQLVEGILRCAANQDAPEAVEWLVESPLVCLDETAAAALRHCDFDVDAATTLLDAFDATDTDESVSPQWLEESVPVEDVVDAQRHLHELEGVRGMLRAARYGPKADFLRTLIRETGYDTTLLAAADGFQRSANVDRLVGLVEEWESEEPLTLNELLSRMRRTREGGRDGPEAAVTADDYSEETVLLMSAHHSKGKEFDIVVLPDLYKTVRGTPMTNESMLADRSIGMALRPWSEGADQPASTPETAFDTFWQTDEFDRFEDAGHTWVAEHRIESDSDLDEDSDEELGQFVHDHPFQSVVADRRAEEFRILYMAVTRACDHLVLGLQQRDNQVYETWGDTLWEALEMDTYTGGDQHTVRGSDAAGDERTVPIGIDDLPSGTVDDRRFSLVGRWRAGQYRRTTGSERIREPKTPAATESGVHHRPRTVSPSSATDYLPGVAEAFRSVCNSVDVVSSVNSGADPSPPGALAASTWGDIVHDTVQLIAANPFSPSSLYETGPVEDIVEAAVDRTLPADHENRSTVVQCLRRHVVPALADTGTYAALRTAGIRQAEELTRAVFERGDSSLMVRGQYDLAYPINTGWRLCDLKTGTPPSIGTVDGFVQHKQAAEYGIQLALYAWAIEKEYQGDVDITSIRLTYLWPTPVEYELSINVGEVPSLLEEIAEGVLVTSATDAGSDQTGGEFDG